MIVERNAFHRCVCVCVACAVVALSLASCGSSSESSPSQSSADSSPAANASSAAPETQDRESCPLSNAEVDAAFGVHVPRVDAPSTEIILCTFGSTTAGGGADFSQPGLTVQPIPKPLGQVRKAVKGQEGLGKLTDHPEWGDSAFAEVQTSTGNSGVLPAGTGHIELFLPSFHVVAIVPSDFPKDPAAVARALGNATSQ